MSRVFADTNYWIALLNEKDQLHSAIQAINGKIRRSTLLTTHEVLSEVLILFRDHGPHVRQTAAAFVRILLSDPTVAVHPQSGQSFFSGLELYEARPDKGDSLTDWSSMAIMRKEGVAEVLSQDEHFTQEGFIRLL